MLMVEVGYLGWCTSQLSCHCDTILDTHSLEERFNLLVGFVYDLLVPKQRVGSQESEQGRSAQQKGPDVEPTAISP